MNVLYILDACAVIALLKDEEGAEAVAVAYEKASAGQALIAINRINLLEVYYGFYRDKGAEYANNIMNWLKRSIITINDMTDDVFLAAGRLKATYRISLADSIALAEALVSGGILLTADHHEFDIINGKENINFEWIK